MKPDPKNLPNAAILMHGLGIVEGDRAPTQRSMRAALADMPHLADALSPAPAPRAEETYDNVPEFANPALPAPRMA